MKVKEEEIAIHYLYRLWLRARRQRMVVNELSTAIPWQTTVRGRGLEVRLSRAAAPGSLTISSNSFMMVEIRLTTFSKISASINTLRSRPGKKPVPDASLFCQLVLGQVAFL